MQLALCGHYFSIFQALCPSIPLPPNGHNPKIQAECAEIPAYFFLKGQIFWHKNCAPPCKPKVSHMLLFVNTGMASSGLQNPFCLFFGKFVSYIYPTFFTGSTWMLGYAFQTTFHWTTTTPQPPFALSNNHVEKFHPEQFWIFLWGQFCGTIVQVEIV